MTKTTAPSKTPSPAGGTAKHEKAASYEKARRDFFVAALTMSWQLAIVVLVPLIGGFKLDESLNTSPALTLVGFFLAMAGTAAIVWRQLQRLSPVSKVHKP
jgi:F0F1-type ATP synthase assembly protein I